MVRAQRAVQFILDILRNKLFWLRSRRLVGEKQSLLGVNEHRSQSTNKEIKQKRYFAVCLRVCIQLYRLGISPGLPPHCRFQPTCSQYALDALEHHGIIRGMGLMLRRLLRCHPWHTGGVDPVPSTGNFYPISSKDNEPRCSRTPSTRRVIF